MPLIASSYHEPPITTDKSQKERFIETARQLGADENEAGFKEKLAVIARQKPKGAPKPEKAKPER